VSLRQKTAKTARWLHIYLSMVSFAVVLFFAATGLTVNHPDWFSSSVKTRQSHGDVDRALLQKPDENALVEGLRTREHLHGAVSDLRVDDRGISFSFRAPGYSADAAIDRAKGTYDVTEVRNGFVAVLNDLHKGRDAGKVWGWLIDASAILLTLVSLTGLIILWFIYKRRTSGLLLAAAGLALGLFVYRMYVP
jgi:hypothetical protein